MYLPQVPKLHTCRGKCFNMMITDSKFVTGNFSLCILTHYKLRSFFRNLLCHMGFFFTWEIYFALVVAILTLAWRKVLSSSLPVLREKRGEHDIFGWVGGWLKGCVCVYMCPSMNGQAGDASRFWVPTGC